MSSPRSSRILQEARTREDNDVGQIEKQTMN